jgi:hypothetical protein
MRVLKAYPVLYTSQHAQGMAAYFLDPGRFDITQFLHLNQPGAEGFLASARRGGLVQALAELPVGLMVFLTVILLANLVRVGLALRGFMLLARGGAVLRYGRWVAAGLVFYVALMTGPLGAARFLVPVWPLLLAFALVGLRGPTTLSTGEEPTPMGEG